MAHFNLTASDASLQTGLRMYSGAIHNVAVANGKARTVPWTLDDIAIELAFRERATKMRARFSKRIYVGTMAD